MVTTVMLVFAFVFLCMAAAKAPELPRLSWGWSGLALALLAHLLGAVRF